MSSHLTSTKPSEPHILSSRLNRLLGLRSLLVLNTASGARRRASTHLLQLILVSTRGSAVQLLVKLDDGLRVDGFEFGLVEVVAGGGAEAVGAATRVGGVVVVVFELGEAGGAPVWRRKCE